MAMLYQLRNGALNLLPLAGKTGVYDAAERVVGTWFGEPLYRRAVALTFPALSTNGVQIFDIGLTSITVTKLECVSQLTDGRSFILPYYDSGTCHLYVKNGKVYAYGSGSLFNGAKSRFLVEYIKA